MNAEQLSEAIGKLDETFIEETLSMTSAPAPHRPWQWVTAVAACLFLVAGLAFILPYVLPDGNVDLPVSGDSGVSDLTGTGGDANACVVHNMLYHSVDSQLIQFVGDETWQAFLATYSWKEEEFTIINFVRFCGVTRESFIEILGWQDMLDQKATQHHDYAVYTYRQYVEAIFGDDPSLTERVFDRGSFAACADHQYHYHYVPTVLKHHVGWTAEDHIAGNETVLDAYHAVHGYQEGDNILNFVEYFGITRESLIAVFGWEDKLDEKAKTHSPLAPYTYGQFVEAIYSEDEQLREWVFSADIFFNG